MERAGAVSGVVAATAVLASACPLSSKPSVRSVLAVVGGRLRETLTRSPSRWPLRDRVGRRITMLALAGGRSTATTFVAAINRSVQRAPAGVHRTVPVPHDSPPAKAV